MEKVHGTLRMGGGRENEALVVLQGLKPGTDISGVVIADFRGNAEVGAKESGAKFRDQFFLGIAFVAPLLAAEVAIEAGRVTGGVGAMPNSA
jgi:hypothetical protein